MTTNQKQRKSQGKDRHLPCKQLRLPLDLYARLVELAQQNGRPISWEARKAIVAHLQAATQAR